jgi:hypothetical protein
VVPSRLRPTIRLSIKKVPPSTVKIGASIVAGKETVVATPALLIGGEVEPTGGKCAANIPFRTRMKLL